MRSVGKITFSEGDNLRLLKTQLKRKTTNLKKKYNNGVFILREEFKDLCELRLKINELDNKKNKIRLKKEIESFYKKKEKILEENKEYISFEIPRYGVIKIDKENIGIKKDLISAINFGKEINRKLLSKDEWEMLIFIFGYNFIREKLNLKESQGGIGNSGRIFWTSTENKGLKGDIEGYNYVVNMDYEEIYSSKYVAGVIYKY